MPTKVLELLTLQLTLPPTYYNRFTRDVNQEVKSTGSGWVTDYEARVPEGKNVLHPAGHAYFWNGAATEDVNVPQFQTKIANWWPIQRIEDDYVVLRWVSLTTKNEKYGPALTKTRVRSVNSADLSGWHYPKEVAAGFYYGIYGRDTTVFDDTLPASGNSIPWTKYGRVKDVPGQTMEFIFNDKFRYYEDARVSTFLPAIAQGNFQWMITIENSNYVPPPTFGFDTKGPSEFLFSASAQTVYPFTAFVNVPYAGYGQWVVAMSPWKRGAMAQSANLGTVSNLVHLDINKEWGIMLFLRMWTEAEFLLSSDLPGNATPIKLSRHLFAFEGAWDNSVTQNSLDKMVDVYNFNSRNINPSYALRVLLVSLFLHYSI